MPIRSSELPSSTISYHLGLLNTKIEEIAERTGVEPSARLDLEACLAALPWRGRRRLTLALESVRVHADSPALRDAVRMMLELAARIWAETPPPDLNRYVPSKEAELH